MIRPNAYPDAVHSRRVRRRKRPRRLHHPFRLLCTCLVLAAMFWALCVAKTETIPLSPLEPAEQPAEPTVPESGLPAQDPLPEDSGAVSPDDWRLLLVNLSLIHI